MLAYDEEVWINQNALEQTDRVAYICSVKKQQILPPEVREKISDLRKSWGIASQDRMDVWIQSRLLVVTDAKAQPIHTVSLSTQCDIE